MPGMTRVVKSKIVVYCLLIVTTLLRACAGDRSPKTLEPVQAGSAAVSTLTSEAATAIAAPIPLHTATLTPMRLPG